MEASAGSQKTAGKGRGARFRHLYEASRNSGGNSITGAIRESYGLAHQAGMNSTPPKSSSKTRVVGEEWKRNPSGLGDGFGLSTVACLAHVKACGGVVNIVLDCPHCSDGEPFTDQEALRQHIKWDHELQHLLYSEDEVAYLKKKLDHELQHVLHGEEKVIAASQIDELKTFTGRSEVTR